MSSAVANNASDARPSQDQLYTQGERDTLHSRGTTQRDVSLKSFSWIPRRKSLLIGRHVDSRRRSSCFSSPFVPLQSASLRPNTPSQHSSIRNESVVISLLRLAGRASLLRRDCRCSPCSALVPCKARESHRRSCTTRLPCAPPPSDSPGRGMDNKLPRTLSHMRRGSPQSIAEHQPKTTDNDRQRPIPTNNDRKRPTTTDNDQQ